MDILAEMESAAKKAVPFLIEQTKSSEPSTRESAVYALAAMGVEAISAIPDLKKVIARDKDRLIREAATYAIKTINEAKEARDKAAEKEKGSSQR